MEEKDNVLSDERVMKKLDFPENPLIITESYKALLEAQAEIYFAAGVQEGRREVVKWIEDNKFHTEGFPCFNAQSWQAFLEENNLKRKEENVLPNKFEGTS